MLLLLIDRLLARWPALGGLHAFDKITLRAALAVMISFLLAIACGPWLIAWLSARFREPIKYDLPAVARLHESKRFTPTMGGIFIIAGLVTSALALCDLTNPYVPIAVFLVVSLGALGAYDDWIKLSTAARGISARHKLGLQFAIATVAAVLIYRLPGGHAAGLDLLNSMSSVASDRGWFFIPLASLVIVVSSNSVNLTDGLDGLAGGCLVCASGAMTLVVYASGHVEWADYLHIPHVAGAGEMVVFAAGMIGGLLGFLWFNCHPASVFMGDTGSLPLGGLLGLLAVIARQEFLLLAIGGVFVAEALSVILQVGYFRWKKRRIFLCAPLHHHFQLKGWPEDKIVVRFWIAGALCAVLGLVSLKLHVAPSLENPQVADLKQLTR